MKNFQNADWVRARQLIPNSAESSLDQKAEIKCRKLKLNCKIKSILFSVTSKGISNVVYILFIYNSP